MAAARQATPPAGGSRPRILRIGIILGGNIVEERLIRTRETITIGQSSKNTFSVPIEGLPPRLTPGTSAQFQTGTIGAERVRLYYSPWVFGGVPIGYIQTGRLLSQLETQIAGLRLTLILVCVAAFLLALALGWVVSGQALRPLGRLTRTAERIGQERDFSRRRSTPTRAAILVPIRRSAGQDRTPSRAQAPRRVATRLSSTESSGNRPSAARSSETNRTLRATAWGTEPSRIGLPTTVTLPVAAGSSPASARVTTLTPSATRSLG